MLTLGIKHQPLTDISPYWGHSKRHSPVVETKCSVSGQLVTGPCQLPCVSNLLGLRTTVKSGWNARERISPKTLHQTPVNLLGGIKAFYYTVDIKGNNITTLVFNNYWMNCCCIIIIKNTLRYFWPICYRQNLCFLRSLNSPELDILTFIPILDH